MRNKLNILFRSLTIVFCIYNCRYPEKCESPLTIEDQSFSFRLVNSFKYNLVASWGTTYISDSVYITNPKGEILNKSGVEGNGRFVVSFLEETTKVSDTLDKKLFYIHLPNENGLKNQDIDTLELQYNTKISSCKTILVNQLSISYNGILQRSGNYESYFEIVKR
jgi:hypothetical protein